jgi:hypothetical protein
MIPVPRLNGWAPLPPIFDVLVRCARGILGKLRNFYCYDVDFRAWVFGRAGMFGLLGECPKPVTVACSYLFKRNNVHCLSGTADLFFAESVCCTASLNDGRRYRSVGQDIFQDELWVRAMPSEWPFDWSFGWLRLGSHVANGFRERVAVAVRLFMLLRCRHLFSRYSLARLVGAVGR